MQDDEYIHWVANHYARQSPQDKRLLDHALFLWFEQKTKPAADRTCRYRGRGSLLIITL